MPRRRTTSPNTSSTPPKRSRYSFRNTRARRSRKQRLADNLVGRTNTLTDEEFRDKTSLLKEKKIPGKALSVKKVNPCKKTNRKEHKTHDYDQDDTILRRGQEFIIEVEFDRNVDKNHDCVTLQLVYGTRPKVSKGTVIRIPLNIKSSDTTNDVGQTWKAQTTIKSPTTLSINITSPPDACIGNYELYVETKLKDDEESSRYQHPDRLIIVFNPFCKNDSVYMEDDACREEYVLNENGKVWVGSRWRNRGRPWNFGQFEKVVLDAALYLLDNEDLGDEARNSPVLISRAISGAVNSFDNDGMLEGNWSGDYSDGRKPWEWTSSVRIIEKFMENLQPVKYGQCWVFSCLTTTLLRSLGIPTRTVTNFDSAHDTDCSMTIDKHYDEEDGEPIEDLDDSTWNFHVWNESWFKRYDLPDGYDGWQALDGTPQETSEGVYRCGPASLKAIKEGQVYMNYDTPFIFSEVNGDKITWQVNQKTGSYKVSRIDSRSVGWNISTKKVGSDDVDILDNQYKYPEGSKEERKVVAFVNRFSTERKKNIYKLEAKPEFDLSLDLPDDQLVGEDFSINVKVKNITKEKKKITGKIALFSAFYTGLSGKRIKTMAYEETLNAGQEKPLKMAVPLKDYKALMNPEASFKVYVSGKNLDTGRMNVLERHFDLLKPDITIEIPNNQAEYGEDTEVAVKLQNTTRIELTKCQFNIESSGALEETTLTRDKPLKPGEEWSVTVALRPRRRYHHRRQIVAEFDCKELDGIDGSERYKVVNYVTDSDDED